MSKPLASLLAASVLAFCSAPQLRGQTIDYSRGAKFWPRLDTYRVPEVAPADLDDSAAPADMIRGGKLYLSLQDLIALAFANNLDIELARYGRLEADTDLLRAKAGAQLSGVQTQISTLSTGQSVQSSGARVGEPRGQADGITTNASEQATGSASTGNAASFFGTQVTGLEPTVSSTMTFVRTSNPQISDFVTGTNTLIQDIESYNLNFSQGFTSGTTFNAGFTAFGSQNNNLRNLFNPTLTSDLSVSVSQRLLQGFGRAVNNRNIRIAKNNREIQDTQFEMQVIVTVSQLQNLYWDLVTFVEVASGRRADLELAELLVRNTKRQVELGLQPRFEITRVEAETTSYRRQVLDAENDIRRQQNVIKNAISKFGPTGAALLGVEIVPTDRIEAPQRGPVEPVQDLVESALRSRPEIARTQMTLTNSRINIKGIRNAMLPSLDLTAFMRNNALAGTVNPQIANIPGVGAPNPFFTGGFGTAVGQLFRRNFPDYGVFLNLNVPLKNRQAQADMTRELLRLRQSDIRLRQEENNIKLDVTQAVESLRRARQNHEISKQARELREQMLEAERKRFALGSSSIFQIVQVQRDLAAARNDEINSLNGYIRARNELDRATGQVLERHGISIEAAYRGALR